MILLAIYNALTIPLSLAFGPKQLDQGIVFVFDLMVDIIFFIDIVINFRTTFISAKTGDEIY